MWPIAATEINILIFGILFTVLIGSITFKLFQVNFPQFSCIPAKETCIVFVAIILALLLYATICVVENFAGTWLHVFLHHLCTFTVILLVILVNLGIWFRKRITDARRETIFSVERHSSSPSVKKSQYRRQMSRRGSKQHNVSESRSPKRDRRVDINYEVELQKDYAQAIRLMHPEETIRKAIRYMNSKGIFTDKRKNAEIVLKIIEHVNNLEEWAKSLGMEKIPGKEFPRELTEKKMEERLMKMKFWDRSEIRVILKETFSNFGFYPIPTEFCEMYEKKKGNIDQLMMTGKRQRSENNILKQKVVTLQQNTIPKIKHQELIGGLQTEVAYYKQRLNCKICFENELSVKVLPCHHVFSCRECFAMIPKTSCIICKMVIENTEVFCLP